MKKAKRSLTLISDKQGDHMTQSLSVGPHDPGQLVLSCRAVNAADATTSWVEDTAQRRIGLNGNSNKELARAPGPRASESRSNVATSPISTDAAESRS